MTFLVGADLPQQPAGDRFRALLSSKTWISSAVDRSRFSIFS